MTQPIQPSPEISRESYDLARKNLQSALALLQQVRGCTPPYFVQRFQACVRSAMEELGMDPKE